MLCVRITLSYFIMNLKLKVYCILLTIVYVVIIANSAYQGRADFKEGLKAGSNRDFTSEIYSLNLEPKDGKYAFGEQLENEKNNQYVSAEINKYTIKTNPSYDSVPSGLKMLKLICMVLMVILVFGFSFTVFQHHIFYYKKQDYNIESHSPCQGTGLDITVVFSHRYSLYYQRGYDIA